MPMLVITSNDGLAPMNDSLVAAVRARGNKNVITVHLVTDHSYSDQRIALESSVIRWLQKMAKWRLFRTSPLRGMQAPPMYRADGRRI